MTTQHNRTVSVTGLGYVGLPVAIAFGREKRCIGFDVNQSRINELRDGIDHTSEVSPEDLINTDVFFTSDSMNLEMADFHIVSVPTPINSSNQPDLTPLIKASETIGKHLKKGDIVVYESTVYPGTTEEECMPVLEKKSGLKCGVDFFIGYSPERISPADKERTFSNIVKIVSGQTPEVLDVIARVYESVVKAGVYRANSIKVAEASKVIENTQRDLNIALMNELAIILNHMEIDTLDVLKAAGTKWNFLPFRPGLVGGHCIGVDPYYLTYKAERLGYHPDVILSGRRINNGMGKYIANQIVKALIDNDTKINNARVAVKGITFKEDCPDIRNSKVIDLVQELQSWGIETIVYDPLVRSEDTEQEYGIKLCSSNEMVNLDAVVICVAHEEFKELAAENYNQMLNPNAIVFDVKGIIDSEKFSSLGLKLWRL